ncbi:protein THYLAKOID ASSEMBLY 8-like, chloroplastic isoform X1 [Malus domestica]|uniref:protein THYLAKOID ASSEMBLY 8-like, chloroplastic isoform X1 n=1 Tax=Malus domestica TaxID=3750 RepID=UPI00397715EB
MPNPQRPTLLLSFGAAVASHFPNKTCISLTDQLDPFITLTADHQFVPFIKPPMATRAFSRSKFAFFSSILLQNLKTTPIKSTPMLLKSTELELESWRSIRGLRLYHDGRPRGPLWRVKKLIGKEALFVISGLKRFEDDEEMLGKFVNTPVLRLLKMDMIVVLTELKRQEEVALAIKFTVVAKWGSVGCTLCIWLNA